LTTGKATSKLEAAAARLERAVARLEGAVQQAGGPSGDARRQAKAEYSALEQTTARVATRLDATIERLNAVLGV
jgi:outer membrane protein TolC